MSSIKSRRKYDIVCAGHICLDIAPAIPDVGYQSPQDIFRPGRLVNVAPATISPGGQVANTGQALARLGVNTSFMAKVGQDEFGKLLTEHLQRNGSVSGISTCTNYNSSYSIVLAPPGIDRIFLHYPGPNDDFTSADIDFEVVKQAEIFHFGYPPVMRATYLNNGEELVKMYRLAKQCGVLTSLDMSLPDPNSPAGQVNWRTILENVLPYVDIFAPGIEEITYCLAPDYYLELLRTRPGQDFVDLIPVERFTNYAAQLIEMGCKLVVLKAGHRGLYLRTANENQIIDLRNLIKWHTSAGNVENWINREIWCPAFEIYQIASATGAGDTAIAGLLAAISKRRSIEDIIKSAACLGFQNLHHLDAVSGIKSWEETQKMLKSGTLKPKELKMQATGWYWDKSLALWFGPNDKMIIK